MDTKSAYLTAYWPNVFISQYGIKCSGPILHFNGPNGVRTFTLRKLETRHCWEPKA